MFMIFRPYRLRVLHKASDRYHKPEGELSQHRDQQDCPKISSVCIAHCPGVTTRYNEIAMARKGPIASTCMRISDPIPLWLAYLGLMLDLTRLRHFD